MRELVGSLGAPAPAQVDGRRRSRLAVAVLVLATAAVGIAQPPAAHAATNRIAGVLTVGGVPAAGVELELMKWSGAEWWYGYGADEDGVTDTAGAFEFGDLAPGTYTMTVHRRFPNGTGTQPAGPGAAGTVTLDADDDVAVDFALPAPSHTARGQVLQLDGTPASGAHVELGAWSAEDHPAVLFSTTADGDGRYVLPLYDDQVHTVTAWSPGHLRTLLGDTTRYWEADTFGLAPGSELPALTLQSQHVGGLVTTAGGTPAPARPVALLRWNHAQDVWAEVASATTSLTGRYAFRNTGEGHFTVRLTDAAGPVFPTTGFQVPVVTSNAVDQLNGPGYRWVASDAQVVDLDLVLPPPPADVPRLRGAPAVGGSLRAELGAWSKHYVVRHHWLRDGTPIAGATAPTYRLVAADGRHRISARVTAVSSYPGLADQQRTSTATWVRARSGLVLRADGGRRSVRLVVRLRLPGTAPARTTGRVLVYVDGRRRAVVTVRAGVRSVTVRRVPAGRHRVVVRFAGTTSYTAAQAGRAVRVR